MINKLKKFKYENLVNKHIKILKSLQYNSGLFAASSKEVSTGYDKSWLRDNFYETLAFEVTNEWEIVEKTYTALLNIFLKHEEKIDFAINRKPMDRHEYIHARFHPETFEEFWEEWGNMQNDSIGAILFKIGELENHHKKSILKTKDQIRITNKLVKYLESIQYWHDKDNGMWEENEEVHSSSVGACVAGLLSINKINEIDVPKYIIDLGIKSLNELLPRESDEKFVDLAQLSLIWPYNIVNKEQREKILSNVEYHLLRKKGVIRYKNDYYYNNNTDGYSEEAEWTFGLAWLAIIYEKLGNKEKTDFFIKSMLKTDTPKGIPELFYSNTENPNENTPLGWSESLFVVALHELNNKN